MLPDNYSTVHRMFLACGAKSSNGAGSRRRGQVGKVVDIRSRQRESLGAETIRTLSMHTRHHRSSKSSELPALDSAGTETEIKDVSLAECFEKVVSV